jgi:hypothetical protein
LSPILVRPVREQLEHDRLIRLLHAKFRRKHEAGMNPGNEQNSSVGTGVGALYPDLVLMSQERGHKLQTVVEVETGESVNHLEALAQWAHFAKTRAAFHLYVPANMVDVARRLCDDNQIHVSEIWSYHLVGDEPRFTLVHRSREPQVAPPRPKPAPAATHAKPAATHAKPAATHAKPAATHAKPAATHAKKAAPRAVKAKPAKPAAKPKKPAKPAKAAKPKGKKKR